MTQTTSPKFRPPIVTFMGHIDHGKTSLLDRIRSANVAGREAGGITQHISSYQVEVKTKKGDVRKISFIDTPGHAAFNAMRQHGAEVTDIIVLIIAASEGIMPQTRESINIIKKSGVPFIVAMNKIDLPGASPEKVKGQLVEAELTPEEYGGQVPLIPVSAKTGEGIDQLLESIILHADILELTYEADKSLEAYVIESGIDKARGPVASVVLRQGTLKVGDYFYIGQDKTKVKALIDWQGKNITAAYPSDPVEILGLTSAPASGSKLTSEPYQIETLVSDKALSQLDPDSPKIPIVAKADTQGTLNALLGSLSDDVAVVHSGVGAVSDNDVFLAESSKAQIVAFNVTTPSSVAKLADNQKVSILQSKIIYEILENLEARVLKMLEPTIDETILGEAKIIAEFKIDKVRIAGASIIKGVFTRGDLIHLMRDGKIIKDTRLDTIRQGKADVESIKMGNECGLTFKPYVDFRVNDAIISYNKSK